MMRDDVTAVPGFRAGSAENREALTGCTVLLCPVGGAVGACDQRGGAAGTRELDPLGMNHVVERVHAIFLTGGSAFGLDAAGGVVRHLERRGEGFPTRAGRVPIVPAAVLYDLGIGRPDVRPDATMAEAACAEAETHLPLRLGNTGAGCGATVGKILGSAQAYKGGLGSAATEVVPGLFLAVVVAVNAFGDVLDAPGGKILAGARTSDDPGAGFADTVAVMRAQAGNRIGFGRPEPANTVIAAVATNAHLRKPEVQLLARMAGIGIGQVVRPANTQVDGDTVFALAAGTQECDVNLLGVLAADLMARAIVRAISSAETTGGIPGRKN